MSLNTENVVLLDVDDTLIVNLPSGQRVINTPLLQGLKALGLKNIYFFTNMGVRSDLDAWIDSKDHITRHKLHQYFKVNDIPLRGVITSADVPYNKGLSAAYCDFYFPALEVLAQTEDVHNQFYKSVHHQDPNQDPAKKPYRKVAKYIDKKSKLFSDLVEALKNKLIQNGEQPTRENCKKEMFKYFRSQGNNASKTIYYFDDDVACIAAVQKANEDANAAETSLRTYPVPVYGGEEVDFVGSHAKTTAIQLLSMYVDIRTKEKDKRNNSEYNSLWARLFTKNRSRDASVKLSAANKLLQYLQFEQREPLNDDEMLACENGRLKDLIKGNAIFTDAHQELIRPQSPVTLERGMMD